MFGSAKHARVEPNKSDGQSSEISLELGKFYLINFVEETIDGCNSNIEVKVLNFSKDKERVKLQRDGQTDEVDWFDMEDIDEIIEEIFHNNYDGPLWKD